MSHTIAAVATPLSAGGIGVIRISGDDAIEIADRVIKTTSGKALSSLKGYTAAHGKVYLENEAIDECVALVFRAPKSYTGENTVEISCHGGPAVVLAIHRLLLKSGFRQAERGEFTFRAFINGKADLTKAEAVREIIDSRTGEGRSRAAGRLAGSLYEEIDSIKKLITDTLASIEVEIEYPEDEETIADSFDSTDLNKAIEEFHSRNRRFGGA